MLRHAIDKHEYIYSCELFFLKRPKKMILPLLSLEKIP
jgi:hypothetical protein